MQTKSNKRTIGNAIFLLGITLGLALAIAAIWGDFEGMSYFYTGAGYDSFSGLNCPILMMRSETATASVRFDNPSDQEIKPYYEVGVSGMASIRNFEGQITVPAQAIRNIQWTVDANDIDLGFFIFIQLRVLPVAGYSTREATCGIVVLDLSGLSGGQIFGFTLAASLLAMVIGFGLRESVTDLSSSNSVNFRNAMRAAGIAASLAMLMGFMGIWLIGLVFCAGTILLLAMLLRFATS
jgi:hypothetical protein